MFVFAQRQSLMGSQSHRKEPQTFPQVSNVRLSFPKSFYTSQWNVIIVEINNKTVTLDIQWLPVNVINWTNKISIEVNKRKDINGKRALFGACGGGVTAETDETTTTSSESE